MILALSKNFLYRLLFGFLLFAITISLILVSHHPVGKWLFFAAYGAILAISLKELYAILKAPSLSRAAIAFALLFSLALFVKSWVAALGLLFFFLPFSFIPFFLQRKGITQILSTTYFPLFYLVFPFATALLINHISSLWLIFAITVSKMTDIGAYFGGKWLGKRPLAPKISPKKTIEGALFGIAASVVTALLFSYYLPEFPPITAAILGILISLLSQYGDLAESLLKREAKVKDSSSIPGVGGLLDVVDSLVFVFPMVYIYLLETQL